MQEIKTFLHFLKRGKFLGAIAAPKKIYNCPWHDKKENTFFSQSCPTACM